MDPTTEARDRFIQHIFTIMAPWLDRLSSGFSLGLDRRWRRCAVARSGIPAGAQVLDICCGTGELAFLLGSAVGKDGTVTGADFCEDMVRIANSKRNGHVNVSFQFADAKALPFPDASFDAVTVAFGMRNIPDTILALREIRRVLRPQGIFLCLELTQPRNRLLLALYRWYLFRVMPFVSTFVLPSRAPYLYLPRSIEAFYQPPEFREVIRHSGFGPVAVDSLSLGIATIYRTTKLA